MSSIVKYDPQASIEAVQSVATIARRLYGDVFRKGVDYGVIPGTNTKPVLLLPGMEKLMRAMNAVAQYRELSVIRDYDRNIFHYEYECTLVDADTGVPVPGGRAIGLASSRESKWRWRNADRVCPHCGQPTIIKGKAEFGGGWLCFAKRGGCGAKFADTDTAITGQNVGRVENPDIADQINTICKIAQKRSLASAVKGAANVSELFTVDLEDMPDYAGALSTMEDVVEGQVVAPEPSAPAAPPPAARWYEATSLFVQTARIGVMDSDDLKALTGRHIYEYTDAQAAVDAVVKAMSQWTLASRAAFNSALRYLYNLRMVEAGTVFGVPDWEKMTGPIDALKYCRTEATTRSVPVLTHGFSYGTTVTTHGDTKVIDFAVALNGQVNGTVRLFGGRTALKEHLGGAALNAVREKDGVIQGMDAWEFGQYRLTSALVIEHEAGKLKAVRLLEAPAPEAANTSVSTADTEFDNLPDADLHAPEPRKPAAKAARKAAATA